MNQSLYRYIWLVSIFFVGAMFSGCFEIVEEVMIREDGSGQASISLNISQSKTKLASIMLLDSINGYDVPTEQDIRMHITALTQKIKKTKGVSNVKNIINFNDYIFSLTCDFASVEALNIVLASISSKKDAAIIYKQKQFSYSKKDRTFKRNHHYNIASEFKRIKSADRTILEGASVTTIYRFDKPVISVKNKSAKISKNQRAVFLRVSAEDLIDGRKNIKNQIRTGK